MARRSVWTQEGVKEKCDMCRDLTGEIQRRKDAVKRIIEREEKA
jgi:hypothetical protein